MAMSLLNVISQMDSKLQHQVLDTITFLDVGIVHLSVCAFRKWQKPITSGPFPGQLSLSQSLPACTGKIGFWSPKSVSYMYLLPLPKDARDRSM